MAAARYRVKEYRNRFTPQRKVFGIWLSMAPSQPTMEAANALIRERVRAHRPVPFQPPPAQDKQG